MKTFYEMMESMQPSGFDVAFLDVSDKSPSLDSIMTSIHYNSYSYIIDYMKTKGLFMGVEPKMENLYPKKCKKFSTAPYVSTTPQEGVNTSSFADKMFINCFFADERDDGSKVISMASAPMMRLVKIYCKKATGLNNFKWIKYYADLEQGLACIVDNVLKSFKTTRRQTLGSYKGAPSGLIVWNFEGDSSLEERITLTKDFLPIFQQLPKLRPGLPLRLFYSEHIDDLLNQIRTMKASMPADDENANNIADLLRMAETAKRKDVGILIKPNIR